MSEAVERPEPSGVRPTPTDDAPAAPASAPDERTGPSLERLLLFSDAVFAIALTLLALDLPVPTGDSDAALWRSFTGHLDDEYLTFLISFLVISRFWMVHHRFFDRVRAASYRLVEIDVLYLLWIVLLPFGTRVLGKDGDYPFGTVLYAVVVALTGGTFAVLVVACARAGLVDGVATEWHGAVTVAVVFLASIPIAFWNPDAGKYFWLVLVLVGPARSGWRALRRRVRAGSG